MCVHAVASCVISETVWQRIQLFPFGKAEGRHIWLPQLQHMGMYGCGLYIDALPQGLSHLTDNWPLFSICTPLSYAQAHSLDHISGDCRPIDSSLRAVQLSYLSVGACLGRRGVRYVCKRLCIGVQGPCLLSDSAGVPFGDWAGGIDHWEGEWGDHWEEDEQEDRCWG